MLFSFKILESWFISTRRNSEVLLWTKGNLGRFRKKRTRRLESYMVFQFWKDVPGKGDKYEEELEAKFYSCKVYFACTAIHHFIDKKASVQPQLYACLFLVWQRLQSNRRCRGPPFLKFCPFQNFQNTEDLNMKSEMPIIPTI